MGSPRGCRVSPEGPARRAEGQSHLGAAPALRHLSSCHPPWQGGKLLLKDFINSTNSGKALKVRYDIFWHKALLKSELTLQNICLEFLIKNKNLEWSMVL